MNFYQLKFEQKIPASIDKVWQFIASPHNLSLITPPSMGFKVITEGYYSTMYEGMIIGYSVSPLLGLKLKWLTEITHVKPYEYFVDEQKSGPYKIWHHQHTIEAINGGVLMKDLLTYVPPFGIVGTLANNIFIKKKLEKIFDYRFQAIENCFGKWHSEK